MRFATAVQRLRTIADRCGQVSRPWEDKPVLTGVHTYGEILDGPADVDVVQVALVLDLPPGELTWGARPRSAEGLAGLLDIDRAPVDWCWRPALWPVANHVIVRPLRIWSPDGPDTAALDALQRRAAESLRPPAPTPEDLHEQLTAELAAGLVHLRQVEAGYWTRDWRREHRGMGVHPESHLWNAVHGYLDLLDALRRLDRP